MSSFTKLYIEILMASDKRQGGWCLSDVKYYEDTTLGRRWHELPLGLYTDGLSVPWILALLFGKWGKYLKPALFHDYWFQIQAPRKWADKEFYNMLILLKCPKWKAAIAYRFLRMFGGIAYKRYRHGNSHLPQCPLILEEQYPTK